MPVYRDKRKKDGVVVYGAWRFRGVAEFADGSHHRISGTPGKPGPYQDLAQSKAGATAAENRARADALRGRPSVEQPQSPKEVTPAPPAWKTIRQHAEAFLATYRPESKGSEHRTKRRIIEYHLLPFFGDLTIEGLKQADVDTFAKLQLTKVSVKTINNRLSVLSTLIRYVSDGERSRLSFHLDGMGQRIYAVPREDVELLAAAAHDPRFAALAPPGVTPLVAVAAVRSYAEAGLRNGEGRGLQWTDIHRGVATIRRSLDAETNDAVAPKHDKVRTVPISDRWAEALGALPRSGLWVLATVDGMPLTYVELHRVVAALYEISGVLRPRMLVHCLRHTFGTEMAKLVPLAVLQELMGHADIQTTRRYIDVNEQQKRDAIAAVWGKPHAANHAPTASTAPAQPLRFVSDP